MKKLPSILFSFLLLASCTFGVQHNEDLEQSIQSAQKDDDRIVLNKLTDFTWDKAYLFHPYTNQATINQKLGFTFKDPSDIKNRDDIYLLVFVKGEKAVQYAEISRKYGELIPNNSEITPSKSTLNVERF